MKFLLRCTARYVLGELMEKWDNRKIFVPAFVHLLTYSNEDWRRNLLYWRRDYYRYREKTRGCCENLVPPEHPLQYSDSYTSTLTSGRALGANDELTLFELTTWNKEELLCLYSLITTICTWNVSIEKNAKIPRVSVKEVGFLHTHV